MLIFIHIHKCAGMSMWAILEKNFRRHKIRYYAGRIFGKRTAKHGLEASIRREADELGFVSGHISYGCHRLFDKKCEYMTMLREPKSRLKSLYLYSRSNRNAFYYAFAKDRTFEEFLAGRKFLELDNGMVRFLSGDADGRNYFINPKPFGRLDEKDFDRAVDNLLNGCVFYGLQEHFDASLLLMQKMLNIRHIYYLKRNEGEGGASEASPFSKDFEDLVFWDDRLYSLALSRFKERLKHWGISESEVSRFRERNEKAKAYLRLSDNVKTILRRILFKKNTGSPEKSTRDILR